MKEFHDRLTALRRDFHRHPELGFHEARTKAAVARHLRDLGVEVHEGAGVIGLLRVGSGNRAIGLRADMDALPINEASMHDYISNNAGVMHACGHDGHMTMLLGNGTDGPNGQPLHAADYDFNDALLPIGAAFWVQLVRDRLPLTKDRP